MNAPEKELISSAVQGDERAFKTLILEAENKYKILLSTRYHFQPTDADEVFQLASIRAWNKIGKFRGEASFSTWFFTILRNAAIDFKNRRSHIDSNEISAHYDFESDYENLTVEQVLEETAATMMERKESLISYRKILEEVFLDLPENHGQIIKMALEDDKSYKEISEELNIPMGTVMSRLFFARKSAQKLIIQYAKRNAVQLACLG